MSEGVFDKLREQLALQEWPAVYLFKFIVPNTPEMMAKASSLFGEAADVSYHESKTGKFVSVSGKEMMLDVDSIIAVYERAAVIKGLIAL